jgi:hypothetical protein
MRASDTGNLPSATGRSLVPLPGPEAVRESSAGVHHQRPSATFLAQLIAIAQAAPQTRVRRRASADYAAARYAAAATIARPGVIKVSL